MKVIKENHSFGVFPMNIVCQKVEDEYGFAYGKKHDFCGSELEITAEDIMVHYWTKYPDYQGKDYGVKCPICGQFIVINPYIIPELVKNSAKEIKLS